MLDKIRHLYSCWHGYNHCFISSLKAYNIITNSNLPIPSFWFKENEYDVLISTEYMFNSVKDYIQKPFKVIYTKNNLYHAFIQIDETHYFDHSNIIMNKNDLQYYGKIVI